LKAALIHPDMNQLNNRTNARRIRSPQH